MSERNVSGTSTSAAVAEDSIPALIEVEGGEDSAASRSSKRRRLAVQSIRTEMESIHPPSLSPALENATSSQAWNENSQGAALLLKAATSINSLKRKAARDTPFKAQRMLFPVQRLPEGKPMPPAPSLFQINFSKTARITGRREARDFCS